MKLTILVNLISSNLFTELSGTVLIVGKIDSALGFSLISTPVQGMALQQPGKREYHRNAVFFRGLNQQ